MYRRIFLEDGTVGISKLLPADAAWLETWINDPETTTFMATGRTPTTTAAIAAQIEALKEPKDWPFAVCLEGYQDPVGIVGLYDTEPITSKAEFRIMLGAPYCGKGVGTTATRLALRFGFERLHLNRIWLGVTADNTRAVRAYHNAGFRYEGLLVDDLYRDGRYYDSIRMAIRRDAWVTTKEKPAEISASGLATAAPAAVPSTGS